jgi:hypothetical protein
MRYAYKGIKDIINELSKEYDLVSDRDWSEETLIFVALALHAYDQLKNVEDTTFQNRELMRPSLDRAWREALWLRQRLTSDLDKKGTRNFRLTRFGNVEEKNR